MKKIFTIIYCLLLAAFTVYISLDTFVIKTVIRADAEQLNTSMFETASETAETTDANESEPEDADKAETTDADKTEPTDADETETVAAVSGKYYYSDDNITVSVSEYYEYGSMIYVADIQVSSAEYLKTAFALNSYGRNITETASEMAADHNAILAINGDNYGSQESGYVIRNGIVYRSKGNGQDVLCIYADGSLAIVDSDDYSADELARQGVWQALSFGPGLIEDSMITVDPGDEVGKAKASNPRTAIGMIDPLHYIFVVSDGRTDESEGLSLYELAEFMSSLGVTTAYNLDGGGSSTMVFQNEVINNPTSGRKIKERSVSDIVYIG